MMNSKDKKRLYRKWENHALYIKSKCDACNGEKLYFCKYDADFCPQCDKWITKNCGDSDCLYCEDRPETPKEALIICEMLLTEEQAYQNIGKKQAIRSYAANEKYVKRT